MKEFTRVTVTICFLIALLDLAKPSFGANDADIPCKAEDIIGGVWELFSTRKFAEVPNSYQDLLQPYQLLLYGSDLSFRRITFSNKVDPNQMTKIIATMPREKFKVEGGIITTLDGEDKTLEQYQCRYFIKDLENTEIKKGTLSLMWRRQGNPLILHAYRRINLDIPN